MIHNYLWGRQGDFGKPTQHCSGTTGSWGSEITMSVGEPISTAGLTIRQTDELNARLRQEIERLRHEASAAFAS